MHVCARATTCPGDGYYTSIAAGDEKFSVIALSDPCSRLCEFRLCYSGDELLPCAPDAVPDIAVRAPVILAHGHTGRQLPLVLKYGHRQHVTLKCQLVGAPCRSCSADDDCFTGGACVDGRCETTALCQ
jgi:hypothetical protein